MSDKDTNKLSAVRSALSDLARIIVQRERIIPESLNIGYGNYSELGV